MYKLLSLKGVDLPGYSAQYAREYHQIRRFHPGYSDQTGEIDKRIFYKKALCYETVHNQPEDKEYEELQFQTSRVCYPSQNDFR